MLPGKFGIFVGGGQPGYTTQDPVKSIISIK
jgi:hypothetical protein